MLNIDQRKSRLEELLDRVRRNRDKQGPSAASSGVPVAEAAALPSPTEPPPVERISWAPDSKAPMAEAGVPDLSAPVAMSDSAAEKADLSRAEVTESEMHRPEPAAETEIVRTAPEPEPVEVIELEPEETLESVTVNPEPEPVEVVVLEPEEEPESVTVRPEPEPVIVSEPERLDEPEVSAAAEEEMSSPAESAEPITIIPAAPEPEPIYAAPPSPPPATTRTVEAETTATSEVLSVRGETPRDWTLSAVLERAWRVGAADTDKS